VHSGISDRRINRFLHVPVSPSELVAKHEMQRELGRRTGTCFQRCVGLDAIGSCHSVTFDIDGKHGGEYHKRFLAFLERAQAANVVIGGAMTDPKGDRSKPPHQQRDADLFLHVVRRDDLGIYVSGAKMHQTGAVNSHWLIFMPTMRLTEADRDWAVVGAVRVDAPGLTYIVGRQTNDTRIVDGGALDAGNAQFAGQESLIVFDEVFVPHEHVFMDGEWACLFAGRALHHLSSLVLCLQNGPRRRLDRGGGIGRGAQRRRERLAHQGQARRDDPSQRDDLFKLHGRRASSKARGVGRLHQR
jgi:4-hydroxybutyryl-CoA dehydratase/vinylacetyl-CoA-Delta-isomerase